MKKFFTLIASALIALSAMAEDQATYLIVGSDICSPITVKCWDGNTYKVYDQVRIEGLTQPREPTTAKPTDCYPVWRHPHKQRL